MPLKCPTQVLADYTSCWVEGDESYAAKFLNLHSAFCLFQPFWTKTSSRYNCSDLLLPHGCESGEVAGWMMTTDTVYAMWPQSSSPTPLTPILTSLSLSLLSVITLFSSQGSSQPSLLPCSFILHLFYCVCYITVLFPQLSMSLFLCWAAVKAHSDSSVCGCGSTYTYTQK